MLAVSASGGVAKRYPQWDASLAVVEATYVSVWNNPSCCGAGGFPDTMDCDDGQRNCSSCGGNGHIDTDNGEDSD